MSEKRNEVLDGTANDELLKEVEDFALGDKSGGTISAAVISAISGAAVSSSIVYSETKNCGILATVTKDCTCKKKTK